MNAPGAQREGAGWSAAVAGLGLGLLLTVWPMLLDAVVGIRPGARTTVITLALLGAATGTWLAAERRLGRAVAFVGPLALGGAALAALLWRGSEGAPWSGLPAAVLAILPASIAIGAALGPWWSSAGWLAGLGLGIALGVALRPILGLPTCLVLAAVALIVAGMRRTRALPPREPSGPPGSAAIALAATAFGTGLALLSTRLTVDSSLAGSGATRATWLTVGLALALAAGLPLRRAVVPTLAAMTAAVWWLAVALITAYDPAWADGSRAVLSPWLAATLLAAIPAALTARAIVGWCAGAPRRRAAALFGAALGPPITLHLLLPLCGPRPLAAALAALLLATSIVAAGRLRQGATTRASLFAVAGLVTIAGLSVGSVWRPQPSSDIARLIEQRHDAEATTRLWQHEGDPALRWLTVNGLTVGQTYGGLDSLQQFLAHAPFVLRATEPPGRMLVVGQGLGVIGREALRHESLDELIVVEASPSLARPAAGAEADDGTRLARVIGADPWIWMREDDETTFDAVVIAGRLAPPGIDDDRLWTREFYRRCRERLSEDGLVLRPVPLDLAPRELAIALQSFLLEFTQVDAWISPPTHLILVGSSRPSHLDPTAADRVLRAAESGDLRRYGWNDGATFFSMLSADRERLLQLAGEASPQTLMHRGLARFAPPGPETRRLHRAQTLTRLAALRPDRPDWNGLAGYDIPAVEAHHVTATRLIEIFAVLGERRVDEVEPALEALFEALRASPAHGLTLATIDSIRSLAVELAPDRPGVRVAIGEGLISAGRSRDAELELREALRLDPRRGDAFALLGRALAMQGDYHAAVSQLDNAIAFGADSARTRFELAVALRLDGARERAAEALDTLLADAPDDAALLEQRALLRLGGEPDDETLGLALDDAERAVRASGARQPGALHTLALALEATGRGPAALRMAWRALELARAQRLRALEPQIRTTVARLQSTEAGSDPGLGN